MKRPAVDTELPSDAAKKVKKDKKSKRDAKTEMDVNALPSSPSPSPSLITASEATGRDTKKAKNARKEQRKEKAAAADITDAILSSTKKSQDEAKRAKAKHKKAHKTSKDKCRNADDETKVKHEEEHKQSKHEARNDDKKSQAKHKKAKAASILASNSETVALPPDNATSTTTGECDSAVELIIARVAQDGSPTLSDLLNPDHGSFDANLKAQWKTLPKKGRAAIVAADLRRIADLKRAGEDALARLPYKTEPDDHCESPPEAYADLAPFLDLVAAKLGKTRATLEIYDPYYCTGAMKKHLGALGFSRVRNECVDFYEMIRLKTVPAHDVLVTNPPYSADHVSRLLQFCSAPGSTPYCLLMPNYVAAKPYFSTTYSGQSSGQSASRPTATNAAGHRQPPLLVCPRKRYNYWTPKGLRAAGKVQGHVSSLGHRTSPFISYWYLDLGPEVPKRDLLRQRAALAGQTLLLCEAVAEFPSALRP